jgi:hypothetical protein
VQPRVQSRMATREPSYAETWSQGETIGTKPRGSMRSHYEPCDRTGATIDSKPCGITGSASTDRRCHGPNVQTLTWSYGGIYLGVEGTRARASHYFVKGQLDNPLPSCMGGAKG